jgi:hypothetical protein
VVAIYVFGAGSIRDFALAVIIGIVVGTYSSIFIASPIYLGWTQATDRRSRTKNLARGTAKPAQAGQARQDSPAPAAKPQTAIDPQTADEPPAKVEIPRVERKLKGKRKKKR